MKVKFVYWQEKDGNFLGCLQDYPDHYIEDLKQHLMDLYHEFSNNELPGMR